MTVDGLKDALVNFFESPPSARVRLPNKSELLFKFSHPGTRGDWRAEALRDVAERMKSVDGARGGVEV
jgi:hypothetical protein